MEDVREAIGIDKVDMSGNLIFVEEHHKANANFIFNAVTSHCIEKNSTVCFVLFHNTFGHFHNVGMKLGYNLKKLENTRVGVVEAWKLDRKGALQQNNSVERLAQAIRDQCSSSADEKVCVIIDDLSHLFDTGMSIEQVWLFIRHLRSFVEEKPLVTLCIGSHVYKSLDNHCLPNLAASILRHFADLIVQVEPLETGFSKSASGKMTVHWKAFNQRHVFKWPEEMVYLYKLLDRQVKLFEPGSSLVM